MSRRPEANRAAQNQQTLKSLVKLESNKSCADCKKNKHPRWASWNLGIFICIRCSGIHRGMGTHISRVKSVDLDSWTDEQLQSMLRWGNTRANKYWEAKLAPGHVPSDTKIENFIRTKYDSKRWVMEGPMPDPATLGSEADDDVPLNVVQEKAKLERSASIKNGTISGPPRAVARPAPNIDLFGDDPTPVQARPNTTEPALQARPLPPKAAAAAPKQTRPGDSLLGLDFFGGTQSAPPVRPSSATSNATTSGVAQRSDLKQSILSLYASAPKPASQPQSSSSAFGGMQSAPLQTSQSSSQSFGGLNDAFSTLNFSSPAPQQQAPKPSAFSALTSPPVNRSSMTSPSFPSGGNFFDSKPAPISKATPPPQARPAAQRVPSGFGDFGDFTSAAPPAVNAKPPPPAASTMGDLFDFGAPAPTPAAVSKPAAPIPSYSNTAFNLSAPAPAPAPKANPPASSGFSNMDAWGSTDAWGAPDPTPAPAAPKQTATIANASSYKAPATTSMQNDFGGWGSNDGVSASNPAPTVTQDDDFGGWSSAEPVAASSAAKPSQSKGFGGGEDLFSNVWE